MSWCFSSSFLFLCHWIYFMNAFSLWPKYLHQSLDPLFLTLGEFQTWDWLWCPLTCGPTGRIGLHMEQKPRSKFQPWPRLNSRLAVQHATLPSRSTNNTAEQTSQTTALPDTIRFAHYSTVAQLQTSVVMHNEPQPSNMSGMQWIETWRTLRERLCWTVSSPCLRRVPVRGTEVVHCCRPHPCPRLIRRNRK